MNTFLTLSIIGSVFFSTALAILLILYGIPKSLSESFYNLGGRGGRGYLFYLMLVITVFLLVFPLVESAGALGFFTAASLAFVGAAAAFKSDKSQLLIHVISAILCASMACLTLFKINKLIILLPVGLVVIAAAILSRSVKKSYKFWLEMIPMYSIFAALISYFSNY